MGVVDALGLKLLMFYASSKVSHLALICLQGKWDILSFHKEFKAQRG